MTGTLENPVIGELNATGDPKIVELVKQFNSLLNGENKLANASLENPRQVKVYAPTIIAGEESRTNTAFGTLTTPDEISGIVVPTNGKIVLNYRAHVKQSVESAGAVALFLSTNQVKNHISEKVELPLTGAGTSFLIVNTHSASLGLEGNSVGGSTPDATTGMVIATGPMELFAAAGTYTLSVQFKSSSGSVTAKERKLFAEVHSATGV